MNIALVLSGGTGNRMGANIPKQYLHVHGKMLITYSMITLSLHDDIHGIQIVAEPSWQEAIQEELSVHKINCEKLRGFSKPGKNRQMSIYHGLVDIMQYAQKSDTVMVHDAARPFISEQQIRDCFAALSGHDGVLPVLPMKDTVYQSEDGRAISKLLNRHSVFAGQAPEVFYLGKYYEANVSLLPDKILNINGSTEPAIMAGLDIAMIPGDEGNFKITTETDFQRFCEIVTKQ